MTDLSVVIPCYNESANLPGFAGGRRAQPCPPTSSMEAIFVDNGSTDDSARALCWTLLPQLPVRSWASERSGQSRGTGTASSSRPEARQAGRVVGWTHADLQTDPR